MLFSEGAYHIPQQEREKERMEERDIASLGGRHLFALCEKGQDNFLQLCRLIVEFHTVDNVRCCRIDSLIGY